MDKAKLSKGEASRQRIIVEAFRLFATLPYERVSFSLMEKEINISRGSMVYYFKNKEGLFREMLNKLVFGTSSIRAVPEAYRRSLCTFYTYFIEVLLREKESLRELGIENLNEALMRIENSALTYIAHFREQVLSWYNDEIEIWNEVIKNAVATGEIRDTGDTKVISGMFEDAYLGQSFKGVFTKTGYDPEQLKIIYDAIYSLLIPGRNNSNP